MTHWYLTKRNWPKTAAKVSKYAGLGGDVWPLDWTSAQPSARVHAKMMSSRSHVMVDDCEILLCTDRVVAEEYWTEAQAAYGDAWLLELDAGDVPLRHADGFDVGFASGGFSVIETELIVQGLPGPPLNDWGLFANIEDAFLYAEQREANEQLEQLDGIVPIAVRVLLGG